MNSTSLSEMYSIEQIITIDPGKGGAIAVWNPQTGVYVHKMPETVLDIYDLLMDYKEINPRTLVVIEKVQSWKQDSDQKTGKQFNIEKMVENFVELRSAIVISGLPWLHVFPAQWQDGLYFRNKGKDKQQRKNDYKQFAMRHFPDIRATLVNSDALCILEFVKRTQRDNIAWLLQKIPKKLLHNISVFEESKI